MKLLVVITSYRVKELTLDCLRSLAGEAKTIPGMKVGICDNGNEDDTADYLNKAIVENGWHDWAYVRTVTPNRGFSGGNNVILREALESTDNFDCFLLLNADTVVRPGAIAKLLESARSFPGAGIIGPRTVDIDGTPTVNCFGSYISPVSEFLRAARSGPLAKLLKHWEVPIQPSENPVSPEWIGFCCVLIRKELIHDVGILDEGYFLYFDDVDYSREARNAGWEILCEPEAVVVHYEGESTQVGEHKAKLQRRPAYWYKSRSWYFSKFYGKAGLLAANALWCAGRVVSFSRELVGDKQPHVCEAEWRDIWKGFFDSGPGKKHGYS